MNTVSPLDAGRSARWPSGTSADTPVRQHERQQVRPRPYLLMHLILAAFAVAVLPLAFAVAHGLVYVDRLAGESADHVDRGVEATRLSQTLAYSLADMERAARQYHVLGERQLLNMYGEHAATFLGTLETLSRLPAGERMAELIGDIGEKASALGDALARQAPQTEGMQAVLTEFVPLKRQVGRMMVLVNFFINEQVRRLRDSAAEARRMMLWEAAALIPITIVLVAWLAMRIRRPVKQLAGAIRRLGDEHLDVPVHVDGPRDLAELGQHLNWMRGRLRELEQQKDMFLRDMSHQLKTPLASICEGAELLRDGSIGPLDVTQQRVADLIRQNSIDLQRMIENLLQFSALRRADGQLRRETVAVSAVLGEIRRSNRLALMAKEMEIIIDADDVVISADPDKLRSALDNLVSNAIRHSPEGATVRCCARASDGGAVIEVIDSGSGVPEAERGRIFEAFYQGQESRGARVRGSGVGLSLARHFVEAHGGTITVTDAPGGGACFRIEIPGAAGEGNREEAAS